MLPRNEVLVSRRKLFSLRSYILWLWVPLEGVTIARFGSCCIATNAWQRLSECHPLPLRGSVSCWVHKLLQGLRFSTLPHTYSLHLPLLATSLSRTPMLCCLPTYSALLLWLLFCIIISSRISVHCQRCCCYYYYYLLRYLLQNLLMPFLGVRCCRISWLTNVISFNGSIIFPHKQKHLIW